MEKPEAIQLFQELRDSLNTIEVWIEPSEILMDKLVLWEDTARKIVNTNNPMKGMDNPDFEWYATDEEVKEVNDEEALRLIYSTHKDLELARTRPEKLAVILYHAAMLEKYKVWNATEEGYGENYEKLIYYFQKKGELQISGLGSPDSTVELKRVVETFIPSIYSSPKKDTKITPSSIQPNFEQTDAFKRVAAIFEKQAFWSGSLSDFVFTFDTLALKGFLKATELEEALAESFAHKGQGKKKIEKLTPEKIKNRRRNMNVSTPAHTASEKIRKVVKEVVENIPSKRKPKL